MNFVAIDFETATGDRASACAVGLVVVENGEITNQFATLVRPPSLEFSPRNIAIHGIKPEDVAKKPTFAEVWPELSGRIGGNILVAHNASFDIDVLHRCLERTQIPWSGSEYACTLEMARHLLPGLPNHRLTTLTSLFGICVNHHDAGSDAAACARLALLLGRLGGKNGLSPYLKVCSQLEPEADDEVGDGLDYTGLEISDEELAIARGGAIKVDLVAAASPDARFAGLRFVFTGELETLTRGQAEATVSAQGGTSSNSVSGKTDFLVVGDAVKALFDRTGQTTGKLARAVELQQRGAPIRIIDESDFLKQVR